MKAKTAKAFAEHFAYLAKHYTSHIYKEENTYSAYLDADSVKGELRKIAQKNGEDENA